MTAFLRLLCAILTFTFCTAYTALSFTVNQMKEMEVKVKRVVATNMPAVVSLIGEKVPGAGSGVVVSEDGLILTAGHVTHGNDTMIVVFPDGRQAKCKVLGADYTRDVGLAKIIEPGKYAFAELGDSDRLDITTIVIALGHPGGYDVRRTPPARIGRISAKNMGGFLVSDCTLVGGDSGGPLFDLDGRVVGIHSSISESLSFNRDAPVNAAKASWDKMLEGKSWGKVPGDRPDRRGQRKP
jgi:serine protease Do